MNTRYPTSRSRPLCDPGPMQSRIRPLHQSFSGTRRRDRCCLLILDSVDNLVAFGVDLTSSNNRNQG